MSGLREKTLLAIAEVHSGNGAEGERIADAAVLALRQWMDAEGLVCVPRDATEEMSDASPFGHGLASHTWAAMIAAAPDVLGEK
jgi:hypothetical protein